MAKLSFLWHLHQPCYRTADGVSHAPWAAIHAGGAYRTLASAIAATGGRGQVVNIVPSLLEQLTAYRDDRVDDPVMTALATPAGELDERQRELLVSWAFHVTGRQLTRYSRLAELARRRRLSDSAGRLAAAFGPADLRDLQVLFVLAQAGEQAWTDERIADLGRRGRGYSPAEHERIIEWLAAQPGELIALWREIADLPEVEISTSPYAHPIMPLLADTSVVQASWAPHPAPEVPDFAYPEDARWQLDQGLMLLRNNGLPTTGCWPPEGAVSTEALSIYAAAGIDWLVTDEGILERSLGRGLRNDNGVAATELYRPWTLSSPSPVLFFRDRTLSDAIGFSYARWDDEAEAARSLVADLTALGRSLPDEAVIVLALDGENPWLHYPDGGGRFLRKLMESLCECGDELEPTTLSSIAKSSSPSMLESLHPGSWINAVFATWIGHPEKTAAWRLLAEVRDAIASSGADRPPSLLVAEASDWFWWLGDDNPTELAPLYDRIFRHHLADACRQADVEPPVDLDKPLKAVITAVSVPVADRWRPPILDGRITSYFEWCLATSLETTDNAIARLSLWGGSDTLHLLLEGPQSLDEVLGSDTLTIEIEDEAGTARRIEVDGSGCRGTGVRCTVARSAELSIDWEGHRPLRLNLHRGDHNLFGGTVLLLETHHIDESKPSINRE